MDYLIAQANKSDKKAILRFYRQQHYPARFLGFDTCYLVREQSKANTENNIIAAVIISQLTEDNQQNFLHALVVAMQYHKQGLALKLLRHCQQHHQSIIAFCQPELNALYLKTGFKQVSANSLSNLLAQRYHSYLKKHQELLIMYSE